MAKRRVINQISNSSFDEKNLGTHGSNDLRWGNATWHWKFFHDNYWVL
jgi:hypothetical protein